MGAVAGFLPSTSGLHFPNSFPQGPLLRVHLGLLRIPVGSAANGLCGGMAYAARDLFEAGVPPPPDRAPPAGGTTLFRYIVRRLFASFDLPLGPLKYLVWQWLPRGDRMGVRGLGWRTLRREWPAVKADIDAGRPSPLGLVRTRSVSPLQLGRNHQVLAYAYELEGSTGRLAISVYDPNHPDDDAVVLALHTVDAGDGAEIEYIGGELPVYGFFRTRYGAAVPPPLEPRG